MNPQEADAVLFEAAGLAEDSHEEQTEATTELETETEEETTEETEEESTEESSESDDEESEESEEDAEEETEEESEEAEDFEIELDGEKLTANRIRDLRDKEKNLTAATTKKWQEIAEEKKAVAQQLDAAEEHASYFADQFKGPLQHMERLDWQKLKTETPEQYQAYKTQYQQLQAAHEQVQQRIKAIGEAKAQHQEEAKKAKIAEAVETLKARHSDWSNELYGKAIQHAVEKLGFPEQAAQEETNPHVISLWVSDLRRAEIASKPKPQSVKKRTLKAKTSKPVDPKAQKAAQMAELRKKGRNGDLNASREVVGAALADLGVI